MLRIKDCLRLTRCPATAPDIQLEPHLAYLAQHPSLQAQIFNGLAEQQAVISVAGAWCLYVVLHLGVCQLWEGSMRLFSFICMQPFRQSCSAMEKLVMLQEIPPVKH